ncbi:MULTISPECIES: NAD(+)--dinitrogen-reductase ADP-D-ribosyltransferase [unclassified Marichromatium]|uniref:NAD(+)--dinitrogen-reductase ADP-D-ribosyltransferase n=1 Tax=unclassified Marichromatium TaxID=2618417 RepID=UPI000F404C5B|nr:MULTISPECIES: NAD(+)--dinitrogen-reductase ADP-D-ribosyltransferase [unclassified Marichromatium]MBO8085684.1 NAD(+)--dinitrogen-reductase ADP-D-ribosyltransferase [Marichromatium sp.]RNE90635.1 NAD(+)--dinitrogen-reductase ADP-D-ribosyltransferase [Marichromatium sp. AB31]RNE92790.1 NAD(+)--dinitrogen-reductase ADP-D-ribosyltransferase [Marichromatium sp. AB32]
MDSNRQTTQAPDPPPPSLPAHARLTLNRCNLPAVILGSLTYQQHPVDLELDGIAPLHTPLLRNLDAIPEHRARARHFQDYMRWRFLLDLPEEAGLTRGRRGRAKADYQRMVRGWSFDSDGREGAVLKRWAESRFGLLARHHAGPLHGRGSETYLRYVAAGTQGLYATNALESQLDLLYTYGQYELQRRDPGRTHLRLYRGINRIDEHEVLERVGRHRYRVLLNNLNSFTSERERADEFGDYILETEVPRPKVFFYNRLLPDLLKGEDEYVVIGGVYEVRISVL